MLASPITTVILAASAAHPTRVPSESPQWFLAILVILWLIGVFFLIRAMFDW